MSEKRRRHLKFILPRTTGGSYLVEMLVAVGISGFLAMIMSMSLAGTMRGATATDNQVIAADLAQEVIEQLHSVPWSSWPALPYLNQKIPVYSNDGVPANPYFPTPLLMNFTQSNWSPGSTANRFNGTVYLSLTAGPTNTTNLASVTVQWTEGTANKKYVLNSMISQYGFHM